MKIFIAYIIGPIIGVVAYSIAVILNSIIQGDFEPAIPGVALFIFGNMAAFVIMAKFTNWLSPQKNTPYLISSLLYSVFTIFGMVAMGVYPFYYYIIIGMIGLGALGYSQKEMMNKDISQE